MKKEKISQVIGNIDDKYINEAAEFAGAKRDSRFKGQIKWISLAAGILIFMMVSIVTFQYVSRESGSHKVKLEDGSVVNFVEVRALSSSSAKIAADGRQLTKEETNNLFGGLNVTEVKGYFNLDDGSIMGVSGQFDGMRVYASVPGKTVNDCVIKGKTATSYVKGVPVTAGYAVTDKNSKGERNIIYFATLQFSESSVYLEHGGSYDDRNTIKNEITSAIEDIAGLGEIGLLSVKAIDNMTFDIDKDGIDEECFIEYGRTSGVFTFGLSVYENGQLEYFNIFSTGVYKLSFLDGTNGDICIKGIPQGENEESCYFDISVADGNIVLSVDGKQVQYWGEQGIDSSDRPKYDVVIGEITGE